MQNFSFVDLYRVKCSLDNLRNCCHLYIFSTNIVLLLCIHCTSCSVLVALLLLAYASCEMDTLSAFLEILLISFLLLLTAIVFCNSVMSCVFLFHIFQCFIFILFSTILTMHISVFLSKCLITEDIIIVQVHCIKMCKLTRLKIF